MRIDPKMTVTRFIGQILIGLFCCFIGYAGLTTVGLIGNLLGLAFILVGVGCILETFVVAHKQSTGEWKGYDE